MTLYDICKSLNCEYEELVNAVVNLLEVTGYECWTKKILDEMEYMHENGE